MPPRYAPEALHGIDAAAAYYERFGWRVARRFRDALDAAAARLAADPTSHARHPAAVGPEVRFVPLKKFPYVLLCDTAVTPAVVLSLLHTAAGPGRMRSAERRG